MEEIKTPDKREYILDVAERLFAEHGFEGVSIREISKAAAINIAMVSYYFGSKEKLYEEVVERKLIISNLLLSEIDKHEKYADKLFATVDVFINRLFENRQFQNIIFRELTIQHSSGMTDTILAQLHKNFSLLIEIIQKGVKNKEFKKVDIELTAMTVIAVIKTYTTSERMAYRILHLENAHSAFDVKYKNRLRKHLREILSNHLGIEEK